MPREQLVVGRAIRQQQEIRNQENALFGGNFWGQFAEPFLVVFVAYHFLGVTFEANFGVISIQ